MIIRRKLYADLFRQQYSLFTAKNLNPSTITQKIITNTSLTTTGICENVCGFMRALVWIGGGSVLLTYNLPEFTVMTLGLVACLTVSSKWFNDRIHGASRQQATDLRFVSEYIGDQVSNIQTIKLLNSDGLSSAKFDNLLKNNHNSIMKVAKLWGINIGIVEFLGIGGLVTILTYGSFQISTGALPYDKIMMILYANYIGLGCRGLIYNTTALKVKLGYYSDTIDSTTDLDFEPFKLSHDFMWTNLNNVPEVILRN